MRYFIFLLALAAFLLPNASAHAADKSDDALFASINQAPVVLIGVIEKVTAGPVGLSSPPLRTYTIKIAPMARVLRGTFRGDEILSYSYRGDDEPKFEEGKEYIIALRDAAVPRTGSPRGLRPGVAVPLPAPIAPVEPDAATPRTKPGSDSKPLPPAEAPAPALRRRAFAPGGRPVSRGGWHAIISEIVPANEANRKLAEMAVKIPIGWKYTAGKLISPWNAWGMDSALAKLPMSEYTCSATGRPALLTGDAIQVTSEQIPAKVKQEYRNPFGDGQFKITVTNTGKMTTEVPALLTDGKDIRWDYSLVFIAPNGVKVLPRGDKPEKLTPVQLEPGASVSGVVDTLLLDGISWPRGGSRVLFTFALGEKGTGNFFYYFSDLHDKIRASRGKK